MITIFLHFENIIYYLDKKIKNITNKYVFFSKKIVKKHFLPIIIANEGSGNKKNNKKRQE